MRNVRALDQVGNGRIGRLWRSLIPRGWRPVFAWMPVQKCDREIGRNCHVADYYALDVSGV